jgi:hypothetical protein
LKYEKYDAADLIVKIMTMIIKLQRCPETWKEGKVMMLPKPCSEEEKDKLENWRRIILASIFYIFYIWKDCRVLSVYSQKENI